jgi:hypothetical protein
MPSYERSACSLMEANLVVHGRPRCGCSICRCCSTVVNNTASLQRSGAVLHYVVCRCCRTDSRGRSIWRRPSARVRAEEPVAVLHEEPSPALRHAALLDLQPQGQMNGCTAGGWARMLWPSSDVCM